MTAKERIIITTEARAKIGNNLSAAINTVKKSKTDEGFIKRFKVSFQRIGQVITLL